MTGSSGRLYTPELLGLAVELGKFPFDRSAPYRGTAQSRSCGSSLAVSFSQPGSGVGIAATSCAVGQASAAIFAQHCEAVEVSEIGATLAAIEVWLDGAGDLPSWPRFHMLAEARAYPGRHEALMLPWKAALDALSSVPRAG